MSRVNDFKPTQHNVQFNGLIHNANDTLEIEDTDLAVEIDRGRHRGTKKPNSTLLAYFEPVDMTAKGEKMYGEFMADIDRKGKKVKRAEPAEKGKPGPKPKGDKKE